MSLTQALSTALSGLTATQTGLALVAGNVANAQTPGYIRETPLLVTTGSGTAGSAVRVAQINRVLDQFVQTQLRAESAGGGYTDVRANLYSQLQSIYGTPGSANAIESAAWLARRPLIALARAELKPISLARLWLRHAPISAAR